MGLSWTVIGPRSPMLPSNNGERAPLFQLCLLEEALPYYCLACSFDPYICCSASKSRLSGHECLPSSRRCAYTCLQPSQTLCMRLSLHALCASSRFIRCTHCQAYAATLWSMRLPQHHMHVCSKNLTRGMTRTVSICNLARCACAPGHDPARSASS